MFFQNVSASALAVLSTRKHVVIVYNDTTQMKTDTATDSIGAF